MKTKRMNKKGIATIYIVIFIFLLIVFVGYAFWDNYTKSHKGASLLNPFAQTPITTPTTPTPVTSDIKVTSVTYPNANLTPGEILTMDSVFLCNPGTPEKLNNLPDSLKKQVFQEYHYPYPPTGQWAVDHYIPLSLGGSNDMKNLWPQPALPVPGYKEKDKVEKYLYDMMCNGTINITTAQDMIKKDWVAVWKQMTFGGCIENSLCNDAEWIKECNSECEGKNQTMMHYSICKNNKCECQCCSRPGIDENGMVAVTC